MASDYPVGRGRPPKTGQFRRGESGNPQGRPKGSRNISTIVTELLDATAEYPLGGKPVRKSNREWGVLKQYKAAMEGSLRHWLWLMEQDCAQKEAAEEERRKRIFGI